MGPQVGGEREPGGLRRPPLVLPALPAMSTAPPRRPAPAPGSLEPSALSGFLHAGVVPALPSVQRRSRRRRLVRTMVVGVAGLAVVALVAARSGAPRAPVVTARATLAAAATLQAPPSAGATSVSETAVAPSLPWPSSGQAAVAIPRLGYVAESAQEASVPVASLTKMMTAYVVLRDHPLAPGAEGPRITITSAEAANFALDTVTDQASVELTTGEILTERQLLEGLLVHSANDFAFVLANWDAGSESAFVATMNAEAVALGLHDSHFADASGFASGSRSSAADLVRLASLDMTDPTFAAIVRMPAVTLPVAGTVQSYTPLVGTTSGVVGVKSGFTGAAGGGDVLAYQASVGGRSFLVVAAVISQEGPTVLATAGKAALGLATAAASHVDVYTVAPSGEQVGRVAATGRSVAAVTAWPATVLGLDGEKVDQQVVLHRPEAGAPAGTAIGRVVLRLGAQTVSVPVETAAPLH